MTVRHILQRTRWFLGGCVAAYAVICFIQGLVLWRLAEWLQSESQWEDPT